jgi:hypothetical protein
MATAWRSCCAVPHMTAAAFEDSSVRCWQCTTQPFFEPPHVPPPDTMLLLLLTQFVICTLF